MGAEKTSQSFDHNSLVLPGSGINVKYQIVDDKARYTLEVDDPNNHQSIHEKLSKQLLKDFWFLSPEIRGEELKQRFGIKLDENTEVELFNFDSNFGPEQLAEVATTLAYYYHSLKDKSL